MVCMERGRRVERGKDREGEKYPGREVEWMK